MTRFLHIALFGSVVSLGLSGVASAQIGLPWFAPPYPEHTETTRSIFPQGINEGRSVAAPVARHHEVYKHTKRAHPVEVR
jgi:hypothetical protein